MRAVLYVATLLACLSPWLGAREPNVIFILTDNQGEWTLGAYGNKDIHTPHIDRLASEGMRFSHAFANNPVCSPNRATLLTGLMPSQHGVHSYLGAGPPQMGEGAYCVINEFTSLGEVFKSHGYACGLMGKWHLGNNIHPNAGFTDHWVTMPLGSTSTFFDAPVLEDGEQRNEPQHLTRFWTQHALKFIEQSKDKPFFLYLPYNGPYGLGPAQLKDCERVPHWQDYAGAALTSFPRLPMHPWQFNNKDYLNNDTCIRRYAAEVTTIDDGVGEVMAKLQALGIDGNTLIVFSGDNGWSGGHHGLWGMGDHTRPKCAFDCTMRVPLIWWQPGKVKTGTSDLLVSHVDFFPTLAAHLGLKPELTTKQKLAGHDYSAVLRGEPLPSWPNTVFYEFEELRCVRTAQAKLIERHGTGPNELYDLAADPDEQKNLIDDPASAPLRADLQKRLHVYFTHIADPEFDMWNGGRSKAPLLEKKK